MNEKPTYIADVYKEGVDIKFGKLSKAIETLTAYQTEAIKKGWEDLYLQIELYDDYGSESISVKIIGNRPETEKEFNKRIAWAEAEKEEKEKRKKKEKIQKEERDKKEFARLLKKYGRP